MAKKNEIDTAFCNIYLVFYSVMPKCDSLFLVLLGLLYDLYNVIPSFASLFRIVRLKEENRLPF